MNLLDALLLTRLRPVKLGCELLRNETTLHELRAQVEFSMTPVPGAGDRPAHEVAVRMTCRASAAIEGERVDVLRLEYAATATYRPRPGFEIDADRFRAGHSTLGRQLYPLVQQRVEPLFAEFGLRDLRLPVEVIPEPQPMATGPTH